MLKLNPDRGDIVRTLGMKILNYTKKGIGVALGIVGIVVVTALAIYLTPLRHYNLISPAMDTMEPKDFYAEYLENPDEYIFVDVRSSSIYQTAHAKGSINIPIENLYDEHYTLPKTGKKIALICTSGRLAAIAYGYLENWGFRNLIHVQGGLQNWAYEDLPLEGNNIEQFNAAALVDEHQ